MYIPRSWRLKSKNINLKRYIYGFSPIHSYGMNKEWNESNMYYLSKDDNMDDEIDLQNTEHFLLNVNITKNILNVERWNYGRNFK
jgi:hypothetical protein